MHEFNHEKLLIVGPCAPYVIIWSTESSWVLQTKRKADDFFRTDIFW